MGRLNKRPARHHGSPSFLHASPMESFKVPHAVSNVTVISFLTKSSKEPMVCMTPRWREVASTHQYRVTRPRFREGVTTERQHKREPTPRKCIGILRGTDGSNPSPSSGESREPSVPYLRAVFQFIYGHCQPI